MKQGPVQATYKAGQIAEFEVGINTFHQGHYEFRICDTGIHDGIASPAAGQKCLDKHLLKRAPLKSGCSPNGGDFDCQTPHPDYPERWMQSPQNANTLGTKYDGTAYVDWDSMNTTNGTGLTLSQQETRTINRVEKMRFVIPEDLNCDKCTLQWFWVSGNNCHYDAGDGKILNGMKAAGWNIAPWSYLGPGGRVCSSSSFGEEFWNCADIKVEGKAPSPPPSRRRKSSSPPRRRESSRRRKSDRRRRRSSRRRKSARRRKSTRRRKSSTSRRRKR